VRRGEQDDELIAADVRDHDLGTADRAAMIGDRAKGRVTRVVAEVVVDVLPAVDVEVEDALVLARSRRAAEERCGPPIEVAPIHQARERVVGGLIA
jgi:hypothetical protein